MTPHQHGVCVEKALDPQETNLGVFLETEGASNCTFFDSSVVLVGHAISPTIVLIRATLEGHLAMAALSDMSIRVAASRGFPQGGVLSPLLWSHC
jgi:hypothetical protein